MDGPLDQIPLPSVSLVAASNNVQMTSMTAPCITGRCPSVATTKRRRGQEEVYRRKGTERVEGKRRVGALLSSRTSRLTPHFRFPPHCNSQRRPPGIRRILTRRGREEVADYIRRELTSLGPVRSALPGTVSERLNGRALLHHMYFIYQQFLIT